jgi:hypothetical protein
VADLDALGWIEQRSPSISERVGKRTRTSSSVSSLTASRTRSFCSTTQIQRQSFLLSSCLLYPFSVYLCLFACLPFLSLSSSLLASSKIPAELKYTTAIHQLFGGRLRSRVTCQKCHHPSDTFDAFLDLSVEVKKCASVKAGFDKFIAKDRLDGSNKYKCEK